MAKKVKSYLKGLVESRARAAGTLQRLQKLKSSILEEIATGDAGNSRTPFFRSCATPTLVMISDA
jgi:hypothetical protein